MSPEMIAAFVTVMQTGGPWSLVIVLAGVIWYLYNAKEKDRVRHDDEKQRLNDRIISMAEKQNDLFDRAELNQKLLIELMKR